MKDNRPALRLTKEMCFPGCCVPRAFTAQFYSRIFWRFFGKFFDYGRYRYSSWRVGSLRDNKWICSGSEDIFIFTLKIRGTKQELNVKEIRQLVVVFTINWCSKYMGNLEITVIGNADSSTLINKTRWVLTFYNPIRFTSVLGKNKNCKICSYKIILVF